MNNNFTAWKIINCFLAQFIAFIREHITWCQWRSKESFQRQLALRFFKFVKKALFEFIVKEWVGPQAICHLPLEYFHFATPLQDVIIRIITY